METAKRTPDVPNGSGSHADGSSVHTDTHCVGNERETAGNEAERVRTRRNGLTTRNSPNAIEIATPKPAGQWRKISIDDGDVYVPLNALIVVPSRRIVFGRAESRDEAIAPIVEGERAGDGDGSGYGDDGDVDGTTSGGSIDSMRVKATRLTRESQHERQSRRIRTGNLPMSSWPPIQHAERPHGLIRHRRRRGRLKIERINVSQTKQVKTTYLERTSATQPPGYDPNRAYGVVRPRRRRGRIKIEPRNVNRTQMVGTTHLGRDNALRSTWRPKKHIRLIHLPSNPGCRGSLGATMKITDEASARCNQQASGI